MSNVHYMIPKDYKLINEIYSDIDGLIQDDAILDIELNLFNGTLLEYLRSMIQKIEDRTQ